MNIDMKRLGQSLAGQFQNLSGRQPGMWPIAPRVLCAVGVAIGVLAAGHFGYWSSQFEEQDALAADEVRLKEEYKVKMAQAINLDALQKQKLQVDLYVERLQRQLPSKAEMAALLSDINQAGVGRGLTFELFKPGNVEVRDYYAELPIRIRVSGSYHDIGAFAGDMANLPRIVTLNNMELASKEGSLTLDATAKTFRYLDQEEAATQRKARDDKKAKEKGQPK